MEPSSLNLENEIMNYDESSAIKFGQDYIKYLTQQFVYPDNLYEMIEPIQNLFQSQGLILYLIDPEKSTINYRQISLKTKDKVDIKIEPEGILPAAVAYEKQAYLIENPLSFAKQCRIKLVMDVVKNCIYCFPVLNSNREVLLVIEIYRSDGGSYSEEDCEYLTEFGKWCSFAIEQEQKGIIETNIQNVRSVLSNIIYKYLASDGLNDNYDQFLTKILKWCADTVQVNRIVHYDFKTTERKLNIGRLVMLNINTLKVLSSRIIIRKAATFVDSVIKANQILNTTIDQSNSVNVNKLIIAHLNNKLRNVLYVPVESNGDVVGVFGLFNSQRSCEFTKADEEFCKLVAHYMHIPVKFKELCEKFATESGIKAYATEILDYELLRISKIPDSCNTGIEIPIYFYRFTWYPIGAEFLSFLYVMFAELCPNYFNERSLKLFLRSTKNSCRVLSYHNFEQTVMNTHFIFLVLKNDKENSLSVEEKAALMLFSVSKYVNFRGLDNETLFLMKHPICNSDSKMYIETSALNFTKFCIEKSNLLNHLPTETSTKIIKLLNIFFTGPVNVYLNLLKARLFRYLNNPKFNANDPKFSDMKIHLLIWSSEYCRFLKKFEICGKLTENLYKELYSIGDFQKSYKLKPIISPEHDRDNHSNLPKIEYDLIEKLVLPMYQLLTKYYPKSVEILKLCYQTQQGFRLQENQTIHGMFLLEDSYVDKEGLRDSLINESY